MERGPLRYVSAQSDMSAWTFAHIFIQRLAFIHIYSVFIYIYSDYTLAGGEVYSRRGADRGVYVHSHFYVNVHR